MTINVSSQFANTDDKELRVLVASGGTPPWVQLTRDALAFVADTMRTQADDGCSPRKFRRVNNDDRIECGVNGVSMSYARNAVRVVYKENDSKRTKTRFFKVESLGGVSEAIESAVEFAGSRNEPRD